jgi:GT2 family glycosyltransferase
VLLLNSDIIITNKDWLGKLVEVAESDKRIGIVGCKLVYPDGKIQHAGVLAGIAPRCRGRAESDHGQYDLIEDMDAVVFAASLIKIAVINKIGMLDGNFMMGLEDTDYCIMARNSGFRVVYDGKVKLTHLEGSTTTSSKYKSVQDTMFCAHQRNYAYYAMKHFGVLEKVQAAFVELAAALFSVESKDRVRGLGSVRLKSRPLWRLGKTIQAAFDGYAIYKSGKRYRSDHHFTMVRKV